ncbi:hypothetical protein HOF40_03670 [Candidatus Parcubacteria bacterium]|jgi:hypothetical protein|nr:hypothetical protein [Candidatus Parcubacteria bacterium]MBT3949160.1 hypothetical protein [Candidatus Parcubacteria bacterium]
MLKARWLNFVLSLTNKIYERKQLILKGVGLGVVTNMGILISQEIFLGFISFPLYLGLRSAKVTAYFEEKGGYSKISFDYNLRRILTLTGAGVIFIIWMIKLLLIIFTPTVFGPLQLYKVSDLRPVDIMESDIVISDTQVQTARVVDKMVVPELTKVDKLRSGNYRFYGTGQVETTVVVFISDIQTVILTGEIDKNGEWEVEFSREDFKLSEGNHQVIAFSFDEKQEIRSNSSPKQYFKARTTFVDKLIKNTDVFINSSIIVVIAVGVLLTVLTL